MTTRTVSGTYVDPQTNQPVSFAVLRFYLLDTFTSGGTTYQAGAFEFSADENGVFSFALPCPDSGAGSARYDMWLPGDTFQRIFVAYGGATTLAALIAATYGQPTASVLDLHATTVATTTVLGHIKPDGTTITVNPSTGVASAATGVTDHGALTGLADDDHSQYFNQARGDARYYTESEVDAALSGKSDANHTHDDRYYTESEINASLATKSDTGHAHAGVYDPAGTASSAVSAHVAAVDPHTQYHTDARGDARYSLLTHTHVIASGLVADAPASPFLGQTYYATDALCAHGTGDFYRWNGTDWRNSDDNVMTTDVPSYLIDCLKIAAQRRGSWEWMEFDDHLGGGGTDLPTITSSSGTATSVGISGTLSAIRPGQYSIGAGTAINGRAGAHMLSHRALRIDSSYAILASAVSFTALSDASDEYNAHIGFDPGNAQDATLSSYGAWFKYDRAGAQGGLSGGNWTAVTRNSSVSTETNTGVAVTTAFQNLAIVMLPTSFLFYINGSLVASHTTNLPLSSGGGFCFRSYRTTNGSNARSMSTDWRFVGYRRMSANSLF